MPTNVFLLTVQRIEGYDRFLFRWWWFAAAIASLMIVLAFWKCTCLAIAWWKRPRANPHRLFHQLSRIHGLKKKETRLLISHSKKLPHLKQAAILFVDPTCWSWANVDEANAKETLETLYAKIFGFPPDTSAV